MLTAAAAIHHRSIGRSPLIAVLATGLTATSLSAGSTGVSLRAVVPPPVPSQLYPINISPDGEAIVGVGPTAAGGGHIGFMYTGGSYEQVTPLPGASYVTPRAVAEGGAMVVGDGPA